MMRTLWLSSIALATAATIASAQNPAARDSSVSLSDSSAAGRANGHSWFVSLLRKIARRSDEADSASVAVKPADEDAADVAATPAPATARSFSSRKDSLAWAGARKVAERAKGYRVVVDLFAKQLAVIDRAGDTLRTAPVATAMNASLSYGGKTWRFETPRGVRTVIAKDTEPVWTPPEWHFAEVALENHLKLAQLQRGRVVKLRDGTKLKVVGDEVGVVYPGDTEFHPLVLDEHIVFDNTLFIPPAGTKHRVIAGELGHFRLSLGDGYLLHGTPYAKSIGTSATHGCIRLHDQDIEWLYENVPVGTKVYLY